MFLEIWLDNSPFRFHYGLLHKDDGTSAELRGIVETSLSGAERLVLRESHSFSEVCLFSWYFKFGILEPATWDDRVQKIVFHNNSTQDIYIWRYAYLEVGQTCEIQHLATQHHELLGVFRPLGMGTLRLTTQTDPGLRSMLNTHGLILYRRAKPDTSIVRIRFILEPFVRDDQGTITSLPEDYGFESSTGELSLNDDDRVILTTVHSKYLFELDSYDI